MRIKELIKNNSDVENITKVQFSVLSPQEIRTGSVVEVILPDTYEGTEPKAGGLFDPHMGVIDEGRICSTCENRSELCPGHFGHIELALPVYNMLFIETIIKVLRCVCFRCSNLLVDKTDTALLDKLGKKTGKSRFSIIYEMAQKIKKCEHNEGCFVMQPKKYTKVRMDKMPSQDRNFIVQIFAEFPQEAIKDNRVTCNKQLITPLICLDIFKKITAENCDFLGFSNDFCRPEWLILTVLPVPPPSVRPSVRQDNNQRSEDDLTFALVGIVKDNRLLRQKIESNCPKNVIDTYHGLLQYRIATFMDNEIPGIPPCTHRSGRPLKSVSERLNGKDGLIRENLMGKRVDFSGRTVISVDPNISIDEFGVPESIATNLTFPEIVTKYNITKMYEYVRNGPNHYPGAKSIEKNRYGCDGKPAPCLISLKHVDVNTIILNYGDIVNRHIIDGDVCLFNRQPSLHRMSMMGMRARVLPGNTFKMNVSTTKPFNADFDGDEMNTHIPQTISTMVELKYIAAVPQQIIGPGDSKSVIRIIQDTLSGAYMLTQSDVFIDELHFKLYMMRNKDFNGKLPPPAKTDDKGRKFWTGQQLFSTVLPDINLKLTNIADAEVNIVDGLMTSGVIDENIIGKSGLIQTIMSQYGISRAHRFLDATQDLITRWMVYNGLSVGIGDAVPINKEMDDHIQKIISDTVAETDKLIIRAQQGLYNPDLDDEYRKQKLEIDILRTLSVGSDEVIKYIKQQFKLNNRFRIMIDSGSKGKKVNLQQICGLVGQQDIWGDRIKDGFTGRTLPHFHKHDFGSMAKGYIRNSYVKGLMPHEFFFHMMAGRTGSIDTAVKTAESGYISRRLIKAHEDQVVMYDNTVRNAQGNILQFIYGDDGFDPVKLEKVSFKKFVSMSNADMVRSFKLPEGKELSLILMNEAITEMQKDAQYKTTLENEFSQLMTDRDNIRYKFFPSLDIIDVGCLLPINISRFVFASARKMNLSRNNVSDINPLYIIKRTGELCDFLDKFMKEKDSNQLFKIYIRYELSAKYVITSHKLDKITFDYVIDVLMDKIMRAFVSPGEMVGTIAAQSIGESSTQLTLNTFHTAGAGSVVTTGGVPRIKEIINISKTVKTPSMRIYLKDEYSRDKNKAEWLMNQFIYTKLSDIISKTEIIYDDDENAEATTSTNEDMEFISLYREFGDILCLDKQQQLSKWVLRMEFDKEAIMLKNIYMSDIQNAIMQNITSEDDIQCIISDDNSKNLILRVKVRVEQEDENFISFLNELEKQIVSMRLRGIDGLRNVKMNEFKIIRYKPDGSVSEEDEWRLTSDGSNLATILANDYVDSYRTFTNDIYETYLLLGIDATRQLIIDEITSTLYKQSAYVNYRHLELLADTMTYKGYPISIDRHGINRIPDNGPIAKASFEEVNDIFIKSAVFSEVDNMKGVSANIMFGQFAPGGTDSFDILFDEEKLLESNVNSQEYEPHANIEQNTVEDQIEMIHDKTDSNIVDVNNEDFEFGFSLRNIQQRVIGKIKDELAEIPQPNEPITDSGNKQIKEKTKKNKNKN